MNPEDFQNLAAVEDHMWYFRSLHLHVRETLSRTLRGSRCADILDAGCGTGGLIVNLRAANPDWSFSAIDLSQAACEIARSRTGLDVRQGDIEDLPWLENSFDAVVCADVLGQVPNPAKALAEAYRVLRPGAALLVNVPAQLLEEDPRDAASGVRRRFKKKQLRSLLVGAGFRGVQCTYWNSLPRPFVWARRRLRSRSAFSEGLRLGPPPLELALRMAMRMEHAWLSFGGRWSWGACLFAVARRPLAEERIQHL